MSCFLAISLVFITIGEDDEKMFTDLAPLLKYTITNHESTEVKAAVSTPLSIINSCYHCGMHGTQDTREQQDITEQKLFTRP